MSWGSVTTSDALDLSSSFQTFQESSVDIEVTLNPGERAHIQIEYNPIGSPTEHLEWQLLATPDGTSYDATPLQAGTVDKELADPNALSLVVEGVWGFVVQGRLIDPDGTPSEDDQISGDPTALVRIRKDGVNL